MLRAHRALRELQPGQHLRVLTSHPQTVAEFLRTGGYERHLRKLRQTYRDQVAKILPRHADWASFLRGLKFFAAQDFPAAAAKLAQG